MTVISDRQLADVGLLSDAVLGFRAAMRGRMARDPDHVQMPDHFRDERYLPRRLEFRRGARIGLSWRQMRTGASTARREDRNRQFRDLGIAYSIDRDDVRDEAWGLLLAAVAQADHFHRPEPTLVHDIVRELDLAPRCWKSQDQVAFYHADGANGVLSTTSPTPLRAMGERGWTSAEAVYHAQKFPHDIALQDAIRQAPDALAAKTIARARRNERRRDWSTHRPVAMVRSLLLRAEQDVAYREFLLGTDERDIVEDTDEGEHDDFWGVTAGHGVNLAGQSAMAVRRRLKDGDRRIHPDTP